MIAPMRLARVLPSNAFARQHLEQHAAEREDVGARIGLDAFDLLRRHVLKRAEDRALRRDVGRRRRHHRAADRDDGRAGFCEAKVQQLRARFRQHHVAGLQIAMDDAGAMRRVERRRDLNRHGQRLRRRERARVEAPGQRVPVEQLHDEERRAVVLADVVQRADVGWVSCEIARASRSNRSRNCGSAASAAGRILTATVRSRRRVARLVDFAHAARAERRQDLVRPEFRSRDQHVNRPIK